MFFRFLAMLASIGIVLVSSHCTVGPDYKAPQVDLPDQWTIADPGIAPTPVALAQWWTLFDDPALHELIKNATTGNLDRKIALARLDEYRALLAVAGGERWPSVGASLGASRQGSSDNVLFGVGTQNQYQVNGTVSWEIDLFGRIRRSIEAAQADYQAEEEQYTDILTSLYADLALTYFGLRTTQQQMRILEENIFAQEQVLELAKARAKHGLATQLEVAQAERLVEASRADLPLLRAARVRGLNELAVLLGKGPGQVIAPAVAEIVLPRQSAVIGIPADVVRQRPDIRRAERQLAAQTARVGIAHAQLYPNLSISALLGRDSLSTGNLFDASSGVWSLGISLGQKLFEGGRLRQMIKVEDARARQSLLGYEQQVLRALAEVESAMAAHVEQRHQLSALERALAAAHRSVSTATSLYREGLVEFQNVLDAQTQKLQLEDRMVRAQGDSAAGLVRLFRALGGGWDPATRFATNLVAPEQ